MSLKINYSKKSAKSSSNNKIVFVDEKFNTQNIKNLISISELNYINDLLKNGDLKKNIHIFNVSSKKKIILISIKKNIKNSEIESLGGELYRHLKQGINPKYQLMTDCNVIKNEIFISHFLHGIRLKSYDFDKYKTKKNNKFISIDLVGRKNQPSSKYQIKFKALEEGTFFARDLVSEPGNVLHPDEYAKELVH